MSGVYYIDPDGLGEFKVFCDQTTAGGGWTVFQKRFDGTVDFFRTWDDYRQGFGNLNGEFLVRLDKIYRLTASSSNKLRVDLEDVRGGRHLQSTSHFLWPMRKRNIYLYWEVIQVRLNFLTTTIYSRTSYS